MKNLKDHKDIKRNIKYYYSQEAELRWFMDFLKNRKSPPRCLRCGSTETKEINIPSIGRHNEGQKKINLDFKHPLCGGDLYIEEGSIRNFYSFRNVLYYDTEGVMKSDFKNA